MPSCAASSRTTQIADEEKTSAPALSLAPLARRFSSAVFIALAELNICGIARYSSINVTDVLDEAAAVGKRASARYAKASGAATSPPSVRTRRGSFVARTPSNHAADQHAEHIGWPVHTVDQPGGT